ncbi:MAG: hypothetical protein MK216_03465 [Candidatus Nitrosopelagicus sp.]|nr:hypothetical protein [Candidatus Nitrosopelagicus sp.]
MKIRGTFLLIILSFSIISYCLIGVPSAYSQEVREVNPALSLNINSETFDLGDTIFISGNVKDYDSSSDTFSADVTIRITDSKNNIATIEQITPKTGGDYSHTFVAGGQMSKSGEYTVTAFWNNNVATATFELTGITGSNVSTPAPAPVQSSMDDEPMMDEEPSMSDVSSQPACGQGTVLKNGVCVVEEKKSGGGCLIATATFGSEMAPQVQFLREIRDNTVLQTESGVSFMTGFNQFYYSFSPVIADYERENPVFKELVKLTITPLLTSLTILNYVDIDTEEEMLGYGIGVILLNIGMYFIAPAAILFKIKNRK